MSFSHRPEELGRFLRSRRDRLRPEDVGLPGGGRRRVPGLRREEVAVLANMGTTWYTWLEQGRHVQPSVDVVRALSHALLLTPDERRHLYRLAGHATAEIHDPLCSRPSGRVGEILEALSPLPAVAVSHRFDFVAWNRNYRFLVDDIEKLAEHERNAIWLHFTDQRWMRGHEGHPGDYAAIVSRMRSSYGASFDDEGWAPLIARLRAASDRFACLWERGDVARDPATIKHVLSSRVGALRLVSTPLGFDETDSLRLLVYTPADELSRERLLTLDEETRGDQPTARRHLRAL